MLASGHPSVVYCNSALGYLFNSTLAYLILKTDKMRIGNYRYLLLVLSIFNMIYTTAQLLIIPIPFLHGYSWSFVQTGFFVTNPALFQMCTLLYCSMFNQSLVLLMYHFVYRYVAICRCGSLPILNKKSTILLLFFIYAASATAWSLVLRFTLNGPPSQYITDRFQERFGFPANQSELVGGAYFLENADGSLEIVWRAWFGLLLLIAMLSATFIVIIYCAYQTKITLNKGMISSRAHQLQVQLYRTLIIQMCVPLVFEYTPCTTILLAPTIGIEPPIEWTMVFFSGYPVLEPLVVIYFVKDYRKGLMTLVRPKKYTISIGATTSAPAAIDRH